MSEVVDSQIREPGGARGERAKGPRVSGEALWMGLKGPMTASGIRQMVKRRARQAGIGDVHPHQRRHTFAHRWLSDGGNGQDLMRLVGWRSRTIGLERCIGPSSIRW
jgi:integrase